MLLPEVELYVLLGVQHVKPVATSNCFGVKVIDERFAPKAWQSRFPVDWTWRYPMVFNIGRWILVELV